MIAMLSLCLVLATPSLDDPPPITVRVPLNEAAEVDITEIVERLAGASESRIERPPGPIHLPMTGLAAPLTRTLLRDTLGPRVAIDFQPREVVIRLANEVLRADGKAEWEARLRDLSKRASLEIARRSRYGFRSRPSYRPNDAAHPTVCLIHGLNSTSGVFKHVFGPLEQAGYGIVVYDFPYNRDLDDSSEAFRRDWAEFRSKNGETLPWAIVAHSMGSLLARSYVEDDATFARDVSGLILIAPPNHGSSLSRAQTFLQMVQGLQAMNGTRRTDPLAILGDGLGAAADDMMPGSRYLLDLNRKKRRSGVTYHILAGDVGYLNARARRQVESRLKLGGMLGGLGKVVAGTASPALDEITDGLGDGCVSVASTRLDSVEAPRILHANHLELIRAPLLFPEPGPVASMPTILGWLAEDAPIDPDRR
ncbi:esterase/lipase family protein [Tundrisphaera lichenicola]|uniref:esterase/lipase family protein n=1 Tax=Tundrisphaera lichenicola TaxID=2029860 RepID=UPI003EBE3750